MRILTCAQCNCAVPIKNHRVINAIGRGKIALCTDGNRDGISCFDKWTQLRTAKKAALRVIILMNCHLGICKKDIEKAFSINNLRLIIERMIKRIKAFAQKIAQKALVSRKRILHHLKIAATITGLEDQYGQIELKLA